MSFLSCAGTEGRGGNKRTRKKKKKDDDESQHTQRMTQSMSSTTPSPPPPGCSVFWVSMSTPMLKATHLAHGETHDCLYMLRNTSCHKQKTWTSTYIERQKLGHEIFSRTGFARTGRTNKEDVRDDGRGISRNHINQPGELVCKLRPFAQARGQAAILNRPHALTCK